MISFLIGFQKSEPWIVTTVTESGGPTAHSWKANEKAMLIEKKVCLILDAGWEGKHLSKGTLSPTHWTSRMQEIL